MKVKIFFFIFFTSVTLNIKAQYFEAIGNGHGINSGGTVYALSGDSANHLLYVLGIFETADDTGYNGNCIWTGTQYESLFNFFNVPATIPHTAKWGDTTVIVWDHSIRLMNGKQLLQALPQTDGEINAACIFNNELYIGGGFDYAGGVYVGGIAKWNGNSWQNLGAGLTGSSSYTIDALGSYNGELIAGGMFTEIDWVHANNIAKWNGISWDSLGNGILWGGSIAFIQSIQEFQNELWVTGAFDSAGNISCNGLVKWNGSWSLPTNCPLQLGVYTAMAIYHEKLYIAGHFHNQSYTTTGYLISYDGTSFGYLPINNQIAWNGWVNSLCSFDNYLYVGGTFDTLGVPTYGIARFSDDSMNNIHEVSLSNNEIIIYPNPALDKLTVSSTQSAIKTISITDILGEELVQSFEFTVQSLGAQINIASLAAGIYLIKLYFNDGNMEVRKVVKN